jgi:hypothetical protein
VEVFYYFTLRLACVLRNPANEKNDGDDNEASARKDIDVEVQDKTKQEVRVSAVEVNDQERY